MYKGIDVSEHQGVINWDKVKEEGKVKFAVLRSSHGENSKDKQFERNYSECKRIGLPIGVYHYYYYGEEAKHKRETQNFLSTIKDKVFELPVFIDYEEQQAKYNPPLGSLTKAKITEYMLYDFNEIEKAGFVSGIYANRYWLETKINANMIPSKSVVWLAEWQTKPAYKGRFEMWQYTSKGAAAGINSAGLDMNEYYGQLGNEEPSEIPSDDQAQQYIIYTIVSGDTLSGIAERFLGDAKRFNELAKLNSIANPNEIYAGEIIKIPKESTEQKPVTPVATAKKHYTVKKGDTLRGISKQFYGTEAKFMDIAKANPSIKNPDLIFTGQKLLIP